MAKKRSINSDKKKIHIFNDVNNLDHGNFYILNYDYIGMSGFIA